MHKDLTERARIDLTDEIEGIVQWLHTGGQSLGIAREAMIAAFDEAAARV